MRRNLLVVALVGALSLAGTSVASAQNEGFTVTTTDVGPTLGLGGIGGANFSFGGRFEKGIKELPNLRNGVLGIQGAVDYYRYDYDFGFGGDDYGWTFVPISVLANYHFRLENRKIDPFFGLGLGYLYASADCGPYSDDLCNPGDGIYFVGHVGIRYFWRPKLALYADAGAGAANLNVGLMFKLGGN